MADIKYATGAVLAVTEQAEGEYTVEQLELQSSTANKSPAGLDAVIPIHWGLGPIFADGYINTSTLELRISIKVTGITIGTFVGNIKTGVKVSVNLFIAKGEVRFYLKDHKELWVHYSLKITFDGKHEGDKKIIHLPI